MSNDNNDNKNSKPVSQAATKSTTAGAKPNPQVRKPTTQPAQRTNPQANKPTTPPAQRTNPQASKPATPPAQRTNPQASKPATPPAQRTNPQASKPATPPAQRTNSQANKPATQPAQRTNSQANKPATQPAQRTNPQASKPATPPAQRTNTQASKPVNQTTAAAKTPIKPTTTATTPTKPPALRRPKSPVNTKPRKSFMGRKGSAALKIIPLGGLSEVGKNITYYEYNGEAVLVDCGMAFPDSSMPGIDIVIPDFTYVLENKNKIKALYVTHGHEDHIGSIPYLLKHFNVPIYATRLTMALIEGKLKEHGLLRDAKLNHVVPGYKNKTGNIMAEFINVNHSIPDACAIALHTPLGIIIQTGDFKVDYTPIAGNVINLARFGELGSQGVLALLSDSTNAERPGSTSSERVVGASLDKLFLEAGNKRIIVATFASNVHRVQQIIDSAIKTGRKVAVSGRSMENVTARAMELGYLKMSENVIIDIEEAVRYPNEKVAIITTGSQGEPMSALSRMARGDHRQVSVTANDRIIISATPIPGNELFVTNVVNDLLRLGANVIYDNMYDIHVSGHACQDELKLMLALTKPKFFVPVHGEYKHLIRHAELAESMGVPRNNIHIGENGHVIEINEQAMKQTEIVTAGKVLVDGLGVGDVGNIVLRDRMHLSEDGLIVVIAAIKKSTGELVSGPDIVSRGFVYVRESEDMISKACEIAKKSISSCIKEGKREWGIIKIRVRDDMSSFIWQQTKRRPMILPVIQEIKG